jgi:hypothetical protein
MKRKFIVIFFIVSTYISLAQEYKWDNSKFESIEYLLPSPNSYRTASGAPGVNYYQQKADYKIDVKLDEANNLLTGSEKIKYFNNSPDNLEYVWVQLDQNVRKKGALSVATRSSSLKRQTSYPNEYYDFVNAYEGGFNLLKVVDKKGRVLKYTINETMMRIDLPKTLESGDVFEFQIDWNYNVNNYKIIGGRSGYEEFSDGNKLYIIAQWFPRMAVYNDREGWQTQQFFGRGEFSLVFGDYDVNISVPSDHILASTGKLSNPKDVLTKVQLQRFEKAQNTFDKPVFIVTEQEARANELSKSSDYKTWNFKAENVRDFAFSSSRKFIWDAMAVQQSEKKVMAMSYYPKEGNPLWERYSTRAVAHTLQTYSKYTFDYPYHKAISINASGQGMEYPMICWNFGRPDQNGYYPERIKYGMIGVIIHEVGHNYFPMIVNTDERKYGWMDEGINSFLEFVSETEWQYDFPVNKGHAEAIVPFMSMDRENKSTIMTRADYGNNYHTNNYQKPATALSILRETVMGRELFDFAFKQFSERWMFKHPTPADFFRTMEDASAMDLSWFWRSWFYTNSFLDLEITNVVEYTKDSLSNDVMKIDDQELGKREYITIVNNKKAGIVPYVERDTVAKDMYNEGVTYSTDYSYYKPAYEYDQVNLGYENLPYKYEVTIKNNGDMIMPVLIEFTFEDGSYKDVKIPAEIWRYNQIKFNKVFEFSKRVKSIQLDKYRETSDINVDNNSWPSKDQKSRFEIFEKSGVM